MIGLVPDVGEGRFTRLILNASTGGENLRCRLFKNDLTPASSYTLADYIEATFTGYISITVSSSDWTIGTDGFLATATAPVLTFAASATTDETVYGYYMSSVDSSTLLWSERFPASFRFYSIGDAVLPQPAIRLGMGGALLGEGGDGFTLEDGTGSIVLEP